MHTQSLFAMTLLLVGSQQLTACTIVDATHDDGDAATSEQDAATSPDASNGQTSVGTTSNDASSDQGTSNDASADDTTSAQGDGGVDVSNDSDDNAEDEDAGASDSTDDQSDDSEPSEVDGGDSDTTSAAEGDAGAVEGTVYKTGSIGLTQTLIEVAGETFVSAAASAGFSVSTFGSTPTDPSAELPCETTTVGNCTLSECEFGVDPGPDPEDPEYSYEQVSAGSVKITGTTSDITLNADDDGEYSSFSGASRLWSGGETLVASASGSDDVPAFSVELTAPSTVTVTAPELSALTPASANRAADFEMLWDDGEEGTLSLSITDADAEPVARVITCSVPASAGGVVVDASLLADFSDEAVVSATIVSTQTETVGDWSLAFTATSSVASGVVEFED